MQARTDKKLRNSAVRNTIYAYLCSTKTHPSVDMIYSNLKTTDPNISVASIYRNVRQLEEIGQIIKVANVDNHERYDANCEDHVHFVCDKCCAVIDIMDSDLQSIKDACNTGSLNVSNIQIVLHGTCEKCSG